MLDCTNVIANLAPRSALSNRLEKPVKEEVLEVIWKNKPCFVNVLWLVDASFHVNIIIRNE